jgi:hypothetical protein
MRRLFLFGIVLAGIFFAAGCDAGGIGGDDGEPVVLNTNTGLDPVRYNFRYSRDSIDNGRILVSSYPDTSAGRKSLDQMLSDAAAASRSDIQSAEVTQVRFGRITPKSGARGGPVPRSKAFPYLSRTEMHLRTPSGPLVATAGTADPSGTTLVDMTLGPDASNVAAALKAGRPTKAFLDLQVQSPDDVGEPFDEIKVEISYSIEVK